MVASGASIGAIIAFAGKNQDRVAGAGHLERVLRDGFADAANDFSLRLACCPRGLFPFPHLSDADYWNRHAKTYRVWADTKEEMAGDGEHEGPQRLGTTTLR